MATNRVSLNVIKWAYVDQATPDTHYTVNTGNAYAIRDKANDNRILFFGLQELPVTLRRYRITGVDVYLNPVNGSTVVWFHHLKGDFDPATITWNNGRPDIDAWALIASRSSGSADAVCSKVASWNDPTVDMTAMQQILQNRGFAAWGRSDQDYVRPVRSGGGTDMIRVTYDTDVVLHGFPFVTEYPEAYSTVDPRQPQTFAWELRKNITNYYCMDESFAQASARFFWRLKGSEEWTVINLTSEMSVTIPAYTWPTASTIQWYVETTDEDGVTDSSGIRTFLTTTTNIIFSSRPIGTEIDTRRVINFSWQLSSSFGDYDQESATLYWRASEDDSWNELHTASAKTIAVPADTFPTYSTIFWYLEATDTGGHTSTYAESQFSTATVQIKAVVYPDGSDISTKVDQTFTWVYSNSRYTDYSQSSATFFWQRVPSETWNLIPISGNIKTLNVPANTFPTSSKISWYVVGTDSGGTTTKTGVKTFETVTTRITPQNCPTSGYWDPRNAITFSWYYSSVIGEYTQQSAVLYWRETGDETWNEIPISGDVQEITIPANTFPVASSVEWYLAGTDTGGTTTLTEQYTFSTTASTAYAVCIKPVGQVEDGTKEITFTWIVKNDDGSLPTRTIVEWKYDTESQLQWKTLFDTVNAETEFVAPAETFGSGAVEWRVSAYNRDLIQGPANVASFVCLHSPEAPVGLTATPVPRTTVRWQSSGQEAYEVLIDGVVVAKAYGPSVYSYQQNEPLADGEHIIAVRVQGQYGLWSNYAEITILVNNTPGATVVLSGTFDLDAHLVWSLDSQDQDASVNVYRDGTWIAALSDSFTFTDRFVIGTHSYYVELWESNGNYTKSNTIVGTMLAEETVIAETSGGEWMNINLTEDSNRKTNYSWQKEYAVRNVLGSEYPIIEVGKSITSIGNFACAFSDIESAMMFERFRGKPVIIKTRKNVVMSGVIVSMNKQASTFYINYSFALQQTSLEDFVTDET